MQCFQGVRPMLFLFLAQVILDWQRQMHQATYGLSPSSLHLLFLSSAGELGDLREPEVRWTEEAVTLLMTHPLLPHLWKEDNDGLTSWFRVRIKQVNAGKELKSVASV